MKTKTRKRKGRRTKANTKAKAKAPKAHVVDIRHVYCLQQDKAHALVLVANMKPEVSRLQAHSQWPRHGTLAMVAFNETTTLTTHA